MNSSPSLHSNFDKAMSALAKLGVIPDSAPDSTNAVLPLIQRIEAVDPENAIFIARVMQQSSTFNEIVRNRISSIELGSRFITISNQFDSIRDDTRDMVTWMEDGRLDWKEQAKLTWMELRRGTVSERFSDIQSTFASVMESASEQISTEEFVLSAYRDFRFSIKEAESAAYAIVEKAHVSWDAVQSQLESAIENISTAKDPQEKSVLELTRDQLLAQNQISEGLYQIAKDLAENLKISYSTSEIIFARLQQNVALKRRIHEQGITFFSTNEMLFTGLSAAFTSTQGLSEATDALEQLKSGVNQSLETLADLGGQQLETSARAGYGLAIDSKALAKLANAIVEYQSSMGTLVYKLREEATANAREIEEVTNAVKGSFIALLSRFK